MSGDSRLCISPESPASPASQEVGVGGTGVQLPIGACRLADCTATVDLLAPHFGQYVVKAGAGWH